MKLVAALLTVLSVTFNTAPKAHRAEQAYVRVDAHSIEKLQYVGNLITTDSPYLLHVYIWDNHYRNTFRGKLILMMVLHR